jgi:hypothetical protein
MNDSASLVVVHCKDATGSGIFTFQCLKKTERRQWEWRFPTSIKLL